jgi:alkanesulfonate monooxygenase SsuD/methylene tetrahydromethanopterin reductase-like flavin-dependent oxidoreductase (luciferase family)
VVEIKARLEAACRKVGRDASTLTISVMAGVLVGRDEAEMARRVAAQKAVFAEATIAAEEWLERREDRWITGTPEVAGARLAEYVDTGIDRLLFQDFLPHDTDHIAAMGELIAG